MPAPAYVQVCRPPRGCAAHKHCLQLHKNELSKHLTIISDFQPPAVVFE